MNDAELKKLHVINCALEGRLTVSQAANALGLSERRIKQLKKEARNDMSWVTFSYAPMFP
jgi:DNA-directed RNA polymerase specialized sigma subunit